MEFSDSLQALNEIGMPKLGKSRSYRNYFQKVQEWLRSLDPRIYHRAPEILANLKKVTSELDVISRFHYEFFIVTIYKRLIFGDHKNKIRDDISREIHRLILLHNNEDKNGVITRENDKLLLII